MNTRLGQLITHLLCKYLNIQGSTLDPELAGKLDDLLNAPGKFDFLGSLYHPSEHSFPLSFISDAAKEAEQNLFTNTRYSLICLGDIGEFIVDLILTRRKFQLGNSEMLLKLNTLYKNKHLSKAHYDILNDLRIIRNRAVHRRTYSQDECKKLLDDIMPLCEWLFVSIISPGDLIHCKSQQISQNIAAITNCELGTLKVIRTETGKIYLGPNDTGIDPWSGSFTSQVSNADFLNMCKYGSPDDIINAINNGANVNSFSKTSRNTALILASGLQPLNVVSALISHGAKINASNRKGNTPLIEAAKNNTPDVLDELIAHDADINAVNNAGHDALYYALNNKKLRNSDVINYMLRKKFFVLCKSSSPEIIKMALKSGINVNSRNKSGNTALIYAACYNSPEAVKILLDAGADPKIRNSSGAGAIDYALKNEKLAGSDALSRLLTLGGL